MGKTGSATRLVGRVSLRLTAYLILLTVILTFSQVVLRYFFNSALPWAEETSRYLFMWIVTLGSAVAFQQGAHMNIDAIDAHLSDRGKKYIGLARVSLSLVAMGLLTYSGILVAWRNRGSSFFSLPGFPSVIAYLSVPVAGIIIVYILIVQFNRILHNKDMLDQEFGAE